MPRRNQLSMLHGGLAPLLCLWKFHGGFSAWRECRDNSGGILLRSLVRRLQSEEVLYGCCDALLHKGVVLTRYGLCQAGVLDFSIFVERREGHAVPSEGKSNGLPMVQ